MVGNATFRHENAAIVSVSAVEAPLVMTSSQFDERLAPSLKRLHLSKRLLERVAGVSERRWWPDDVDFEEGAIKAGKEAIAKAGIEPGQIGLMINTSVTRRNLEPSVAVRIHHGVGLPSSAINFDVANACLGFVNGITLAANMIDSGQIDYALIVASEDSRPTQELTFERLNSETSTREDYLKEFATLTLGSGAAAAVIGRHDLHPESHRIVGGVSRAGTQFHELCVGGPNGMFTDTKGLLDNGLKLVVDAWKEAQSNGWDWRNMDRYVTHQVSNSYTNAIIKAVDLVRNRVPITFPKWGNVGPASLPMTLAQESATLKKGDRVLCMGVGSGLNTTMMELAW